MSPTPVKLLIEGPPRVGKSTAITRLVELLAEAGLPMGGFVTRELCDGRRRVGFCVRDLAGAEVVLAHEDLRTGIHVGRFGVDVPAFERVGLPALDAARRIGGIVVVDEIARMELASSAFADAVTRLLDASVPVVATVHVHPHPITDGIKARPDVELIEVTERSRDDLPGYLFERLTGRPAAGGGASPATPGTAPGTPGRSA